MSKSTEDDRKYNSLLQMAERMCANKERCVQEITMKLQSKEAGQETISNIIDHLTQHKFIDEERYCRAYAKDKFTFNKWGRIKIKTMLKQRGIAETNISQGLDEIEDEKYHAQLRELLESKWATSKGSHFEKKGKAMRFLQSRGYEYHLIMDALEQMDKYDKG